MSIDLNLFTVFDAIYTERSITKAADRLHLSQPAVSHALAKLRNQFDDPLFIRSGNQMRPTAVANAVIEDVQVALHQLEASLLHSRQFEPSNSTKQYKVAMHSHLETHHLPALMERLQTHAPLTRLVNTEIRRGDMESSLASGKIDLAIDVLLAVSDNVKHMPIEQDDLVVVVRKDHPSIKRTLDRVSYLSLNHVLVSSRMSGIGLEDFELGRLGLQRNVILRCRNQLSACKVVEQSDLLLTLPKTSAQMFANLFQLNIHDIPVDIPAIDTHLYWHASKESDPPNKWLRNQVLLANAL